MTPLAITGWGAVHPAGVGASLVPALVTAGAAAVISEFGGEPIPPTGQHLLADFDVRALLGRKGTSFYDRATAMAVVACGEALRAAGIEPGRDGNGRTGVVLGTTLGSFKSTSDYSRETLIQDKPYLVNPVLFPNTVMNCAAGQVAIRYGLRGVNSTVATGPLAIVSALKYAQHTIARGYSDVMLAGAVEEFSAHRAWWIHRRHEGAIGAGEGAAVFVVRSPDAGSPDPDADVLGIASGFATVPADALAACIRRVLGQADAAADNVAVVLTGDSGAAMIAGHAAAVAVLGHSPHTVHVSQAWGDCDAAGGGLALAAFLTGIRTGSIPDGSLGLLTATSPDGGAGAVLVRGWAHGGADRG